MQDRKWVFKQKQRIPLVAGRTVGGARSPVFFSLHLPSPPPFDNATGGAAGTPSSSRENLRAGFAQCVYE